MDIDAQASRNWLHPVNAGFSTDADLPKPARILRAGDEANVGALLCTCWMRRDAKGGPTRSAGPVRPPPVDLIGDECEQLDALIKSLGSRKSK